MKKFILTLFISFSLVAFANDYQEESLSNDPGLSEWITGVVTTYGPCTILGDELFNLDDSELLNAGRRTVTHTAYFLGYVIAITQVEQACNPLF